MGYHLCNWRPKNKKKEQNRRNIGKDNDQQFSKTEKRHQPTDLRSSVKSKNSKLKKKNSVQSLSHIQLLMTPWIAARQASLSITNPWSLPKLMSIESVTLSSHLILCHPLLLLPLIFPSIRVFSNESPLHMRWPKYWSFSFSISPFSEHTGLISFRMDWLDLLTVQGTLKSLLQHHSSKASILQRSAFSTVQHPYMTTGKTIALTRRTFVGKVMSLLFNMLSRLVITFLPRNKHLLISWLQSPSAVILEPRKIKSASFYILIFIYLYIFIYFSPTFLEQFPQSYWEAVSPAVVLSKTLNNSESL